MTTIAARISRSTLIAALVSLTACSSDESSGNDPQGGTGGTGVGTGGKSSTGGTVSATGGVSTGGSVSTTGGSATGGSVSATGGAGKGGATSTGGAGTGGSAKGGASGAATGGAGGDKGGGAGEGGKGGSGGSGGGSAGAGGSPLPPVTDYAAPGPFKTDDQTATGPDGTYTVIYPDPLGQNGLLHAPITFGPGTGMQVSQLSGLLHRFASHGFVVIGRQLDGGPGDAATRMRMTAGLDWIIAQNSAAGSMFQGKIDVKRAVAMGYSVGGTGAVEIGGHEAIVTVVSIHGHGAEGDLHGPLLLIGGTEDKMNNGMSWLAPTYAASQVQTFFSLVIGANHGYIQGTVNGVPGGVETPAMVAWLRYWIYNDQDAKKYFYGDDCVMCDDPWTDVQRKNWQ